MTPSLSLTGRQWVLRRDSPVAELIDVLAKERGLDDVVTGKPLKLSDPLRFPEAAKAVARIEQAINNKETIGIFGDYDADGITGCAQLVRYFRRHGVEPVVHLPHRATEGYGMKIQSLNALHAKGVKVLITVDTGIAATAEIAHAKALGMDVIVTDHHAAPQGRPDAYAVLHPLLPTPFPNQHLSGSGVALMLVRALEHGKPWAGIEQDIILAAIGTIGDLVPLTGENRGLVIHALRLLSKLPDSPLKDFADAVRGQSAQALTSTDIAFRIVPRINASGRIDHPIVALQALLDGGDSLEKLHALNTERQGITGKMVELAVSLIDPTQPFLCVASSEFHSGVVGLIAGALTERYGRPSLVAAVTGDICTASLRSIPQVNVAALLNMSGVRDLLITYGGHAQAAGCTFNIANLAAVQAALNACMREQGFTGDAMRPVLHIDATLPLTNVTIPFTESIQRLEPFGMGNDQPVFLLQSQSIEWVRTVGADGKHLQCRVGGKKAVGFGLGAHAESLTGKEWWDVACTLSISDWNDKREVQLLIKDIRGLQKQKE